MKRNRGCLSFGKEIVKQLTPGIYSFLYLMHFKSCYCNYNILNTWFRAVCVCVTKAKILIVGWGGSFSRCKTPKHIEGLTLYVDIYNSLRKYSSLCLIRFLQRASEHCPLAGDKQSSLMTLEVRVEDYFNLIIQEILHYGIWQYEITLNLPYR